MLFLLEIIICSTNANYITICFFRKVISESLPQMLILSCGFPCFLGYVPSHHSLSICWRHRIVVRSDVFMLPASCPIVYFDVRAIAPPAYACVPLFTLSLNGVTFIYFFYIINLRAYDQVDLTITDFYLAKRILFYRAWKKNSLRAIGDFVKIWRLFDNARRNRRKVNRRFNAR